MIVLSFDLAEVPLAHCDRAGRDGLDEPVTGWWRANAVALGALVVLIPATALTMSWNEWTAIRRDAERADQPGAVGIDGVCRRHRGSGIRRVHRPAPGSAGGTRRHGHRAHRSRRPRRSRARNRCFARSTVRNDSGTPRRSRPRGGIPIVGLCAIRRPPRPTSWRSTTWCPKTLPARSRSNSHRHPTSASSCARRRALTFRPGSGQRVPRRRGFRRIRPRRSAASRAQPRRSRRRRRSPPARSQRLDHAAGRRGRSAGR